MKILCVVRDKTVDSQGNAIQFSFFQSVNFDKIENELVLGEHIIEINEKTRKINTAYEDTAHKALLQANHGLKAIHDEASYDNINSAAQVSNLQQLLVPIVVTNAELLTLDFDEHQANLSTGFLGVNTTELKQVPWVVYNFDPPDYLLITGRLDPAKAETETLNRRHTLIVNSNHLQEFLNNIPEIS